MISSGLSHAWRLPPARNSIFVFVLACVIAALLPPAPVSVGSLAAAAPAAKTLPSAPMTHPAAAQAALPDGVDADWWTRVQAGIAREMRFILPAPQREAGVYQAHNATTNLAITFGAQGGLRAAPASQVDIQTMTAARAAETGNAAQAAAAAWEWGLRPQAVGVGEQLTALSRPVTRSAVDDTLANGYNVPWLLPGQLDGGLVEWFHNGSRGLRQSFTIAARPAGPTAAPLALHLAVEGDLHPLLAADGQGVTFAAADGTAVLTYSGLHAFDAAGRNLPAAFHLVSEGAADSVLAIVVEDAGAVYPVTIDPLIGTVTSPAWSTVGETQDSGVGASVASAGDVNGDGYADVIVGAPGYNSGDGKVYVFHGSPVGLTGATTSPAWSAAGEVFSGLGLSVAGAGDVNGDGYADVLVGAYRFNGEQGKVYVFHGGPGGLTGAAANPAWSATGETSNNDFGYSVAGAGDVNGDGYADVIVSASDHNSSTGKVYVFHGSLGGVIGATVNPAWSAVGEGTFQYFGRSVASAGDVNSDGYADVVVGASHFANSLGKVYVFHGSPGGVSGSAANSDWSAVGEEQSYFGYSVAGAGDVNGDGFADLVVGAYGYGNGLGRMYVFHGGVGGLDDAVTTAAGANWNATGEGPNATLGTVVASAGDVDGDGYADIVGGSPLYNNFQGKVHVFRGSAVGVIGTAASPAWSATGEAANGFFGVSVATAGDVNGDGFADLIVGASLHDSNRGKVYAFHGAPEGLGDTAAWDAEGQNAGETFGYAVANAGDVNGDGYADIVVGAAYYNNNQGRVYVFHGGPNGISGTAATPAWSAVGENGNFGIVVAGAGDVNGDGYADIIVSAATYNTGFGKVYVFHGGPSGITGTAATPAWSAVGDAGYFGSSVAGVGDVNGDGYADIVIGAIAPNSAAGQAYVFHGSASGVTGTATTPAWSAVGEAANNFFGYSTAGAGDVNGDGYADIIISAYAFNGFQGKVYVFHGNAGGVTGTTANPAWSVTGEAGSSYFGNSLAGAGDVNGDGFADVVIGAPQYNGNQGKAYVFQGSAGGVTGTAAGPAWSAVGEAANNLFGATVASAGDVNGDGYADIAAGAQRYNNLGKAYVFHGGPSGVSSDAANPAWGVTGEGGNFGASLSGAGDVNGDGYADLVVGANSYNSLGKVYIFHGGDGRPVLSRQLRSDGSTPVQPWGSVTAGTEPIVRMAVTSPWGRQRAKLQVQACPPGAPLGDTSCTTYTSPTWADIPPGANGATLSLSLAGLGSTLYRWRARVLYAPYSITQPGVTAPANPPHSPWRRLDGQADTSGVRVLATPAAATLSISKSGSGSVTSSPAGIDCGATCSSSFAPGIQVTLNAVPAAGYTFLAWTEGGTTVSTSAGYIFTLNADRSLVAVFAADTPMLYLPAVSR